MGVKIRQKPKGSGIWYVFVHHHGERVARKVGPDRKLAVEIKRQVEEQIAKGAFNLLEKQGHCPTLKEYVDGWHEPGGDYRPGWRDVIKLSRKRSTQAGYDSILDTHLLPRFGTTKLDQITSRQVGDFIVESLNNGLRSQTVRNIKNCLSAILRRAVNPDNYIQTNPAHGVEVPRPEGEKPSREPDPFSWEERAEIEEVFLEHYARYYALVLCGFRAGLRIGELIALQIGDIDFRHKTIYVQRNVTMGRVTTPKSRAAVRLVRMTSQLAEALRVRRREVKEESLLRGWGAVPDWMFPADNGGLINYFNFVPRVWNKAMEKSGLRRRTPHDMRHTYATLRLSKGDSLAEVSKEMGHSTTEITYRTYYRWMPQESRSNIDDLDNLPATNRNPGATKKKKG